MKNPIHDLEDYTNFMEKQLRTLRHFERCLFAMWCVDHLLATYADLLAENLPKPDLQTIRQIVNELWETLLEGVIPDKDQLNVLDMDFMEADARWGDPASDVHPVATLIQQSVGMCILGCRRNDVDVALTVAQSVIDCLDCKLEVADVLRGWAAARRRRKDRTTAESGRHRETARSCASVRCRDQSDAKITIASCRMASGPAKDFATVLTE